MKDNKITTISLHDIFKNPQISQELSDCLFYCYSEAGLPATTKVNTLSFQGGEKGGKI